MEITGTLKEILPVEKWKSKDGKDYQKVTFAINTDDQYNPEVAFEIFGKDKVEAFLSEGFMPVDALKVTFNLSSNKWKDRYFTTAKAWRVERDGGSQRVDNTASSQNAMQEALSEASGDGEDDLPF